MSFDRGPRAARAVRAVSDVAVAALEADSDLDLMEVVAEQVVRTIGADGCLYCELPREGWSEIRCVAPSEDWERLPLHRAPTSELTRQHPGCAFYVEHPDTAPFSVTDVVPERTWYSTEFMAMLRPAFGRSLQFAIPVARTPDTARGWITTRDGVHYSEADRDVAAAIQPVLDVVTRQHLARRALPVVAPIGAGLTPREVVVLGLVAEGGTAPAIARRLGISPRTVHKHLQHSYRKLGVQDRLMAVRVATAAGVLVAPPAS